jgi:hypothetical protein
VKKPNEQICQWHVGVQYVGCQSFSSVHMNILIKQTVKNHSDYENVNAHGAAYCGALEPAAYRTFGPDALTKQKKSDR